MLTVEGVYRNGIVELPALPADIGQTRVLITFLEPVEINLAARGISAAQAADLRARLGALVEDWERPEMDIYDED